MKWRQVTLTFPGGTPEVEEFDGSIKVGEYSFPIDTPVTGDDVAAFAAAAAWFDTHPEVVPDE